MAKKPRRTRSDRGTHIGYTKEQKEAQHIKFQNTIGRETLRCCATCDHLCKGDNISPYVCFEGGFSKIGDINIPRSMEDCNAWIPKKQIVDPETWHDAWRTGTLEGE